LNKVAVIVAATAAATVLGAIVYSNNNQPAVVRYDKNASSTEFMLPQFVPAPGFNAEQVREIQKDVCGGIGRGNWVPQEVFFAYLEPRDAVFRIPCGLGSSGNFFRTFYFSGLAPTIIDEYHPNAQSLFYISSEKQAVEYIMYFSIVLAGEMDNKQFVLTEEQYDRSAVQCNSNDTSVPKKLTVSESDDDKVVDLNFIDRVSGLFEHREYLVTRDGDIMLLGKKTLGSCDLPILG